MSSKLPPNSYGQLKDVDPDDVVTVIAKIIKIIGDILKK